MEVSAGRQTIIEAKPEPLTVNCAETVVIVVDMQNDFCSKGGLFHRAGINISAVQKAVGTDAENAFCRTRGRDQNCLPEDGLPG